MADFWDTALSFSGSSSDPTLESVGSASGYSDHFDPSALTPGAGSWTDVLKEGISRFADYKIATIQPQAQTSSQAATQRGIPTTTGSVAGSQGGLSLTTLVLLAGLGFLLLKAAG